jgi:IclR family transcriptional regulator, pca regulon regulatory protein
MDMNLKSASRILDTMEMLAATTEAVAANRVAEKLGVSKRGAQGLLAMLAERGYLARVGVEYVLPAELRNANWAGSTRARLVLLATPVLGQLAKESSESAYLATLVNDEIHYLARELSTDDVRYDASLAHKRPVYCSATGIVMLAHQSPELTKAMLARIELKAYTSDTVTDRGALLRWIKRARRDGFAVTHGGYTVGGSAIAAPLLGPTGEVLAALAIGGATERFKARQARLIETVVAHATALSRRLSGLAAEGARGS